MIALISYHYYYYYYLLILLPSLFLKYIKFITELLLNYY
ncbi:hypothetical protein WN944_003426 [Citrus x changshan-huyou]|uniref:Uncharacterized protein n=1 Tax=Citrus x changshan-huyou TaxID=2935761 RepID=A0AAP0QHK7_9ROSI